MTTHDTMRPRRVPARRRTPRPVATKHLTRLPPIATVRAFRRDPLALFADIARQPDGMARTSLLGKEIVFLTHPDHVRQVMQGNHQNYDKDAIIYRNARPFLGDGLPVARGDGDWLRRRRLVQPAFHQRHLHLVTEVTERHLVGACAEWQRLAASGTPVDLSLELTRLTMRIACQILFDVDVTTGSTELAGHFDRVNAFTVEYLVRPFPPLFVPSKRNRAFHHSMRSIHGFLAEIVRARLADPDPPEDLLALLLGAHEQTGETLTPEQLRSEMISLFFAGHDTLANTLTWTWYLLAQHPEADRELHGELSRVLGGRPATLSDLPNLPYTRMVIEESMRLFPVVWCTMRHAIGEDTIAGYRIPAGAELAWSSFVGNRHPAMGDDPESFRPERFDPGRAGAGRYASGFGEGPRICLGSNFAMAEACLVLATLAQDNRAQLRPGRPVELSAAVTLNPRGGLWTTLHPRNG
jgi:cytochrome P450